MFLTLYSELLSHATPCPRNPTNLDSFHTFKRSANGQAATHTDRTAFILTSPIMLSNTWGIDFQIVFYTKWLCYSNATPQNEVI